MCKYCDSYVKDEDIYYIDNRDFKMFDDSFTIDFDVYICSSRDSRNAPVLESNVTFWGSHMKENIIRHDIKFCPFCGVNLLEERKKFLEKSWNTF